MKNRFVLQAILTKWLKPNNRRQAAIKATAAAGTLTVPYDHALDSESNHRYAAERLALKMGWLDKPSTFLAHGGMPDKSGNGAFVIVNLDEVE